MQGGTASELSPLNGTRVFCFAEPGNLEPKTWNLARGIGAIMPGEYNYRSLVLWQKAQGLALAIIRLVAVLPRNSVNDVLVRQIVRSSSSIGANVAEGHGRFAPRAHAYHLSIAKGSACETDSWLDLLRRSGAITAEQEGPLHSTVRS